MHPIFSPENVARLYDLVQIEDEDVRTAFYYALRDTLVAKDLDQASRIAYGAQRYRVVTLGGDLIETTGILMTFNCINHISIYDSSKEL